MKRVLAIGGPTASGKTRLAVDLAQRFGAVVVSADAMQVYRGMDIGTGKATKEEQGGVVHYGFDLRDPDEAFDASDFVALCDDVLERHPRVIVAGGTSLYIRSLRRGLVDTPDPDPALRQELDGVEDLHGRLAAVDPVLAERLHPNDRVRLVRGIEVFELSGRRLSDLHDAHAAAPDRVEMRGLWLDRDDLDDRIDRRVLQMVEEGYVDEVARLLERYDSGLKPLRSLGYRHLAEHVEKGLALGEAIRRTQRDTRRFSRKQRTWGKNLGLDESLDALLPALDGWWSEQL